MEVRSETSIEMSSIQAVVVMDERCRTRTTGSTGYRVQYINAMPTRKDMDHSPECMGLRAVGRAVGAVLQ